MYNTSVLVDIDYWLNCIKLKLLQLLLVLVLFIRFLFCVLSFLPYQIISLFQAFVFLAYVHLSLNTNLLLIYTDVNKYSINVC